MTNTPANPTKTPTKPAIQAPVAATKTPTKPTPTTSKPAIKAAVKTIAKPVSTAPTKTATAAPAKAVVSKAAKPVAKPTKPVDKAEKPKKVKLVRDSFTVPKNELNVLDDLKLRALSLKVAVKKSELLRAGIKALAAMTDATFLAALKAVPALKTGRPKK